MKLDDTLLKKIYIIGVPSIYCVFWLYFSLMLFHFMTIEPVAGNMMTVIVTVMASLLFSMTFSALFVAFYLYFFKVIFGLFEKAIK